MSFVVKSVHMKAPSYLLLLNWCTSNFVCPFFLGNFINQGTYYLELVIIFPMHLHLYHPLIKMCIILTSMMRLLDPISPAIRAQHSSTPLTVPFQMLDQLQDTFIRSLANTLRTFWTRPFFTAIQPCLTCLAYYASSLTFLSNIAAWPSLLLIRWKIYLGSIRSGLGDGTITKLVQRRWLIF